MRMLRALRRRRMVGLVADVGIKNSGGVRVAFFGRDTYFPAGPARLSRLSGAPIVFGCAIRTKKGTYDIVIGAPILPRQSVDERADMESMTQQVVDQLESLIRRHPDQWYMFRDMWPANPLPPRQSAPAARLALVEAASPGTAVS
jgi:KDO2-lipid IV(A) lauroyltransferase